jgi:AcrR family transcriptional regulator
MPSQKSTAARDGVTPTRARGLNRVAAILDAAISVFAAKGYDAATMTEIAERSSTAIGSLYRFFPTKDALAEALVVRFRDASNEVLEPLVREAPKLTSRQLAHAFTTYIRDRRHMQAAALAIVEGHASGKELRLQVRKNTRQNMANVLLAACPGLDKAQAQTSAAVIAHVLKAVTRFIEENTPRLIDELDHVLELYIDDLRKR